MLTLYRELIDGETIDSYEDPLTVGEFLIDLVQEDWDVFSEGLIDAGNEDALFDEIVQVRWDDDSGDPIPRARGVLYTRRQSLYHTSLAEVWDEFCRAVMAKPTLNLHEHFHALMEEDLWRSSTTASPGTVLFRGRIGFADGDEGGEHPWTGGDIGAPPPDKATAGRANKEGQVVMYAAEDERTAVAEVRPWRGVLVSLCKIRANRVLSFLDRSHPAPQPNPFVDEYPDYEVEFAELLNAFANELSKPLRRADNPDDYLPCQKLSEFVQRAGFDGIKYPSAMNPNGVNVVIFDPAGLTIEDSWLVRVDDIEMRFEKR